MSRIILPGNLYSKIFEFLFLFNHMHEFLHFYLFIIFSRGLQNLPQISCGNHCIMPKNHLQIESSQVKRQQITNLYCIFIICIAKLSRIVIDLKF